MTKLEKIERQIGELNAADQRRLRDWLASHRTQPEDRSLEDSIAGQLRLLRQLKGLGGPRNAVEIDADIRQIRGDE